MDETIRKTRRRLTINYFLVIMIIVGTISISTYFIQVRQLDLIQTTADELNISIDGGSADPFAIIRNNRDNADVASGERPIAVLLETAERAKNDIVVVIAFLTLTSAAFGLIISYILAGRTIEPLITNMQQQKRFISDASHELRTPLAAIKAEAEVMLRDENSDLKEYQEFAKSTVEEVDYLSLLSTRLLSLAKLNGTGTKLNIENQDIYKLLQSIQRKLKQQLAKNQLELTLKSDAKSNIVKGDAVMLKQLFTLLLDNAIKYNQPQGTINIFLASDSGKLVVKIANTGKGIPSIDLEKVFTPFYRASTSRTDKGHGLGLAIAREIVALHKGEISISSEQDEITEVTVKLPR